MIKERHISYCIAMTLLLASGILPNIVVAKEKTTIICDEVDVRRIAVHEQLAVYADTLVSERAIRDIERIQQRTTEDSSRLARRRTTDEQFKKQLARLYDAAGERVARHTALAMFEDAVSAERDIFRTKQDETIVAFRETIDLIIENQRALIDHALREQRDNFDIAVTKTRTDCDEGENTSLITRTFERSLDASQEHFATTMKEIAAIAGRDYERAAAARTNDIEHAADIRREAIEAAADHVRTVWALE